MEVSVVICAYTLERWYSLVAAVGSALDQTTPALEVLVVVDHNPRLLERASRELAGAVVVANQLSPGLSGARNTGVETSSGDVVAFLDDDAYAERDWLEKLVEPLADPAVAGTGGWVLPGWEVGEPPWFPQSFLWTVGCSYAGLPGDGATVRNPIGANMAVRREVFQSVGGFSAGIGRTRHAPLGCEETELCARYNARHPGRRFVIARQAVVHHRVPQSRLSWRYFAARCWAEGLSKAAVVGSVGAQAGLGPERAHVVGAIPREAWECVRGAPARPLASAARCGLLIGGTVTAATGLLWGLPPTLLARARARRGRPGNRGPR